MNNEPKMLLNEYLETIDDGFYNSTPAYVMVPNKEYTLKELGALTQGIFWTIEKESLHITHRGDEYTFNLTEEDPYQVNVDAITEEINKEIIEKIVIAVKKDEDIFNILDEFK